LFDFERPHDGEIALLVHIYLPEKSDQDDLNEFIELVSSAQVEQVDVIVGSRRMPVAKTFVGKGKLEEINTAVKQKQVDVVIFNHALSPSQERNLEKTLECRVLDRTGLILDIFAQRAHSFEGKLQVELAQLRHLSTRLVRGWTHLERQKGGIGLRGPGETQLETDRQLLGKRIKNLNNRLAKVTSQRKQNRAARTKAEIPSLSLVGYTNAGKSTLFNALTGSDIYVADQLFATLDPTLRKLEINQQLSIILADTVGFIRHLPHDLVAAFRATLIETREAELILHVVDAADENRQQKIKAVNDVLDEVGAGDVPQLLIYNKIDLLNQQARVDIDEDGQIYRVWLSAKSSSGFEYFYQTIADRFADKLNFYTVILNPQEGNIRARLHQLGAIEQEQYAEDGSINLQVKLSTADIKKLCRKQNLDIERFENSPDTLAGAA